MRYGKVLLLGILAVPLASADAMDMDMDMSVTSDAPKVSDSHSSDDSMSMEPSPMSMEHHHGRPILADPHLEPQQRKYWEMYSTTSYFNSAEGNKGFLWLHASSAVLAFGFMAPLSILCSTDPQTQWFYIPFQTVQTVIALASLFFLGIYSATAPKLYPGNAYSGFSIALLFLIVTHWLAMITRAISSYLTLDEYQCVNENDYQDTPDGLEPDEVASADAFALDDMSDNNREPSLSSTEYGSGSETDLSSFDAEQGLSKRMMNGKPTRSKRDVPLLVQKLAKNSYFVKLNSFIGKFSSSVFHLLNYPMFFTGFGYLLTGLATAFLMGKGKKVFALLAHFIKGFVFFALGFVELGRLFGLGASKGWAWNHVVVLAKPKSTNKSILTRIKSAVWPDYPTFEFVQSFLIFFYGATNVFLEHLGNEDGVWSHKDLQHASIAFMFFGGGLCGLILESNTVSRLTSRGFRLQDERTSNDSLKEVQRGYSLNPMPAFIIFWTGALMSHHQQETELSTQIHVLWGTMFSLGAVIRLITIGLLFTKPHPSTKFEAERPQRPFTEILVAFCLVCGGLIFMSSNRETVEGMIYRGMDQMFTLNVSVGVSVLLMSYFIGCLTLKGLFTSKPVRS